MTDRSATQNRASLSARLGDRTWIHSDVTPGPWRHEPNDMGGNDWVLAGEHVVATVSDRKDAALVAMAPELLCLLASVYARLTTGCWSTLRFEDKTRWMDMLAETLSRAGMDPPHYSEPRRPIPAQTELFG